MRHDNKRLSILQNLNVTLEKPSTDSLYFCNSFSFLLTLTLTQMTSHESSEGGNTHFPHGRTCTGGFSPHFVGGAAGSRLYDAPQYAVQLFEEHQVPRCRVRMTLEPHPL
jgi:hypothetical protein